MMKAMRSDRPTPISGAGGDEAHVELTCPACRRGYRLRRASVPPSASALRCRSCGAKIRLPGRPSMEKRPARGPLPAAAAGGPRYRFDLMTPTKRLRRRRLIGWI